MKMTAADDWMPVADPCVCLEQRTYRECVGYWVIGH